LAKYVKPKEAAEAQGVHERTLTGKGDGRIEAIRTPSGQRRYNIESLTAKSDRSCRKVVAYAWSGSLAQQPDLNRLFAALSSLYPQAEVIAIIGGGLN
jgi:predicted site-specific integrase-resolvase